MPKVTVILNSYNQRRFLAEAVDSVLQQTFPDFELIVVGQRVNRRLARSAPRVQRSPAQADAPPRAIDL